MSKSHSAVSINQTPQTVTFNIFDYDSCIDIFGGYLFEPAVSQELAAFKERQAFFPRTYLIKKMLADAQLGLVFHLNGSIRQDLRSDTINRFQNSRVSGIDYGSCFYFHEKLAAYLQAILPVELKSKVALKKLSITDVHLGLKEGETFDHALSVATTKNIYNGQTEFLRELAIKRDKDKNLRNNPKVDDSKITLLFIFINYYALHFPNDELIFNFFDDREELIKALNFAFTDCPELLPKNVTLNLHAYWPESLDQPTCKFTIRGTRTSPIKNLQQNAQHLFSALKAHGVTEKTGDSLSPLKIRAALQAYKKSITPAANYNTSARVLESMGLSALTFPITPLSPLAPASPLPVQPNSVSTSQNQTDTPSASLSSAGYFSGGERSAATSTAASTTEVQTDIDAAAFNFDAMSLWP